MPKPEITGKPNGESTALVSKTDVQRAKVELDRMRGALKGWLKYRLLNDAVAAGTAPTKKSRAYAREVIAAKRNLGTEQQLARQLHVLLSESFPDALLPDPDITKDPQAAVELAKIAIGGPLVLRSPQDQGAIAWWWPAIIVGGILLTVTTIIKTSADSARDSERFACIQAGGCTDYGFWLKAGGIAALAWVAWQLGGERIKGAIRGAGKGSSR